MIRIVLLSVLIAGCSSHPRSHLEPPPMKVSWEKNYLTIQGDHLPGKEMKIHYLEAYCRANSQTTDWGKHTVIPHKTELVWENEESTEIRLRCKVSDGVVVDHTITSKHDEIDFRLVGKNLTDKRSEAHWAQPCVRVGAFTGLGNPKNPRTYDYIKKSFIFLDGKLARMPTKDWAKEARYIPGQVWAGPGVPKADVNPRPLNPNVPSNGLIGCFSSDDKKIFAMAFDPYQELFQGVITCLHSDFRLGGLKPKEELAIRGKIYIIDNHIPSLLKRYHQDFPAAKKKHKNNTP